MQAEYGQLTTQDTYYSRTATDVTTSYLFSDSEGGCHRKKAVAQHISSASVSWGFFFKMFTRARDNR